jgi:hypothetical protein
LLAQKVGDSAVDPERELVVGAELEHLRDLIKIEERNGTARHLLGAPIGVAVELHEQTRDIEPCERSDGGGQRGRVRHEAFEVGGIERDGLAGGQRDQRRGGLRATRGADAEGELLDQRGAVGLRDEQPQVLVADGRGRQRKV